MWLLQTASSAASAEMRLCCVVAALLLLLGINALTQQGPAGRKQACSVCSVCRRKNKQISSKSGPELYQRWRRAISCFRPKVAGSNDLLLGERRLSRPMCCEPLRGGSTWRSSGQNWPGRASRETRDSETHAFRRDVFEERKEEETIEARWNVKWRDGW